MTQLIDDLDVYSDLLLSVGTNDPDRPLTPIECSDLIVRLKEETGDTWEQISKRLQLGKKRKISTSKKEADTTQVRLFEQLQNLSRRSVYKLGFGRVRDGKVGFTIGCLVAALEDKRAHDIIIDFVLDSQEREKPLKKTDVQNICNRVRGSPETPVEEILEHVYEIKPKVEIINKIAVSPYSKNLEKIHQLVKEKQITSRELLTQLIQKRFKNNEIKSMSLSKSNVVWITMDDDEFKKVETEWKSKKLPINTFFNQILEEVLKDE